VAVGDGAPLRHDLADQPFAEPQRRVTIAVADQSSRVSDL
jgi:hypothetical protein